MELVIDTPASTPSASGHLIARMDKPAIHHAMVRELYSSLEDARQETQ